ncbi:histone-lysine N-methyltransferase, H3 lysine-9 specific SUVH6-like [Senna tora]|uniref:Histone-lysine N-methyltransferase, H3 lysine-9 specific SUVH6-like n=1 Tax=Senna tora TaxID=362788 RepID=A0A835CAI5_9FABA|nr:histone-lysine N-methyltransferase, H3 lysine-9 specific SUVH6-like [Senna tora]
MATLSSGGFSEEGFGKPLVDSNRVRASCSQPVNDYDRRRVSAIRDYPPGFARFAARKAELRHSVLLKKEDVEHAKVNNAGLSAAVESVKCESDFSNISKDLRKSDVGLVSSRNYLQKAVTRRYHPLGRVSVSAVRQFPHLCGRNVLSVGKKALDAEKGPSKKIAATDVREVEKIVRDGDASKAKLKGIQLTGGTEERKRKKIDYFALLDRSKVSLHHSGKKRLKKKKRNYASEGLGKLVVQEDTTNVHRSCGFNVIVPPLSHRNLSGPSTIRDSNVTRNTVRETLRLYQAVYRKLLREEEAKLRDQCRRVDLKAAMILKGKGKYVNTGNQILGSVPGIEVGDEFHYRVELNVVGLHRHIQNGIDYVKDHGKILATSIVASGGYTDELDNSDVLIYSGQGGNVMNTKKEPEDQKLERGNLALKNSSEKKTPVRVIRGSSSEDGRHKTYVYDGLYVVEKYWQDIGPHGKLIFMFQMRRIPGQPELAWIEVKKSKKFMMRKGVCVDDISNGNEAFPISAVNTIDDEKPPSFTYTTRMIYPDWCHPITAEGCNCTDGCTHPATCSCAFKNGGIPFNHSGSIVEVKPLVYECGPSCKCPSTCYNRVSQNGIRFLLEIFKTEKRGWGVRSLSSIPSGSFICEYIGELLDDTEAEKRTGNDEYLFDIGKYFSNNTLVDGLSRRALDPLSSEVVDAGSFTIDAASYGNVGRFVNHSCSPNLYAQNVLYDHNDRRFPHVMLFAFENIPPLQELTYDYNYIKDQVFDSDGNIKKKDCYCGSVGCTAVPLSSRTEDVAC